MLRFVPLALLAASPAVADPRVDPAGAPAAEALRGTVLVWHDAPLYTDAADTATQVRVGALDASRKERLGRVVPLRVVGTRGAFVEVEPGDGHCTVSRLATSDDIAKLRLFVKRADLAPALAKPFEKVFPDGTRLALRPGVPVIARTDGGYAVWLRGGELKAEIPSASVGHSYTFERRSYAGVSADEYEVDAKAAVTLGGQPVALGAWKASAIERRGETTLATLEEDCATVQVAVPTKAVREAAEDVVSVGLGSGGGGGVLGLRDEHYLPIATTLSVGGRPVAMVAKPIYLPAAPSSKTVCIDRRVWLAGIATPPPPDVEDKLRLCAPAAKVVHEPYRRGTSANGTTQR